MCHTLEGPAKIGRNTDHIHPGEFLHPQVVLNLISHGALLTWKPITCVAVAGHGKNTLDWTTRLKIASGAAQGLAYLHKDCKPQVVHRDVKSCNILLDADMEAHVADFGIAKNIQPARTHTSTHVMGTIGYIDPEYAQTSRLNDKSDVYSFGIVLLELLSNKKAVDDEVNLLDWVSQFLTTLRASLIQSCK